jgi:hypothetical protein
MRELVDAPLARREPSHKKGNPFVALVLQAISRERRQEVARLVVREVMPHQANRPLARLARLAPICLSLEPPLVFRVQLVPILERELLSVRSVRRAPMPQLRAVVAARHVR